MITRRGLASLALRPSLRPGVVGLGPRPGLLASSIYHDIGNTNSFDQAHLRRPTNRAWESTATTQHQFEGEKSGHIAVHSNESILFFDNIFPLKLSSLLSRPWATDQDLTVLLQRFESSSLGVLDPIRLVKNALPPELPVRVIEILPRLKDGGAFVKFQYSANIDPAEIEATLSKKLQERPLKPWFNPFRRVKARLVQGTPWLEDLYRYPTSLIKVEFVPPEPGITPEELSEENLYTLFRKYGKIADIVSQPPDSKVTPRYAHLTFPLMRDAIMARNCLHGLVIGESLGGGRAGTKLRLSYEKRVKANSFWNWLTNHPRIVIPVLAALIAGVSVLIFDPIREFFIKVNIQHSLKFKDSRVYKWLKKQTDNLSIGGSKDQKEGLDTVWNHRRELIEQVHEWLDETSDTFIVVTGPKGSGKVEMIMDQSLEGRKNVLRIDCRPIIEARGEAGTIKQLAAAVGYRPVFSWANSISSMVDLAVQSTTGVKAGFSETLESQLNKILQSTASALKEVAVSDRDKKDSDANLSEDAYLEAHPERRPVVVIDNFFSRGDEKSIVYDKIAEWAATVVQNNAAHVIFLTSNTAYSKPLAKALPDRVFRTVSLGDLEPDVAKNFILSRLADDRSDNEGKTIEKQVIAQPDLTGLDECIRTLGGRLTDLEFLARRLRNGQNARQAVEDIVGESATDVVRIFLLGKPSENEKAMWTKEQAWHLIKTLASSPTLRYNQVLLSNTFASSLSGVSGDAALDNLAGAELIAINTYQGRPQTITVGKPLHQAAFTVLIKDGVLRAKMDLDVLTELVKIETKNIDKYENELSLLGSLPRQSNETGARVFYLLDKLDASQSKISKWEKEMVGLKKVLVEQY